MPHDKQWILTGTASLVKQDFGIWTDDQAVRIGGAVGAISFDGTNEIALDPAGLSTVAWTAHPRCAIWVRGAGATFQIFVAASEN